MSAIAGSDTPCLKQCSHLQNRTELVAVAAVFEAGSLVYEKYQLRTVRQRVRRTHCLNAYSVTIVTSRLLPFLPPPPQHRLFLPLFHTVSDVDHAIIPRSHHNATSFFHLVHQCSVSVTATAGFQISRPKHMSSAFAVKP